MWIFWIIFLHKSWILFITSWSNHFSRHLSNKANDFLAQLNRTFRGGQWNAKRLTCWTIGMLCCLRRPNWKRLIQVRLQKKTFVHPPLLVSFLLDDRNSHERRESSTINANSCIVTPRPRVSKKHKEKGNLSAFLWNSFNLCFCWASYGMKSKSEVNFLDWVEERALKVLEIQTIF